MINSNQVSLSNCLDWKKLWQIKRWPAQTPSDTCRVGCVFDDYDTNVHLLVSAGKGAFFGNFGFVKQKFFTPLVVSSKHVATHPQWVLQDHVITSVNPRDVSKINQNCNLAPDHSKQNQYDYFHIIYSFSLSALLRVNSSTQFSY